MVRIKFKSRQDQVNGFYELATKARIRSLPNEVFEISDRHLRILDDAAIAYEIVQRQERPNDEAEALRNSLTVDV